ncbi:hypothetical protein [uncultured Methanobrevibacter sp.]|uniref:hypothetical protein n=1 Tax=uncultured Methanobrevibacter sp. TaxID=253161 RepID=UPI0025D75AC7|nr:hypothetical protein [uncultured Methanobrevibacter sp.]
MDNNWENIILPIINNVNKTHIAEIGHKTSIDTINIFEYCKKNDIKLSLIDFSPMLDVKNMKNEYLLLDFYDSFNMEVSKSLQDSEIIFINGNFHEKMIFDELQVIEKNFNNNFPIIFLQNYLQCSNIEGYIDNQENLSYMASVEKFIDESNLNLTYRIFHSFPNIIIIFSNNVETNRIIDNNVNYKEILLKELNNLLILTKQQNEKNNMLKQVIDKNNQKLDNLNDLVEKQNEEIFCLNKSLQNQKEINFRINEQVNGLLYKNSTLFDRTVLLTKTNNTLVDENKNLQNRIELINEKLANEKKINKKKIEEYSSSNSWKITKPLRKLNFYFKQLKNKFKD